MKVNTTPNQTKHFIGLVSLLFISSYSCFAQLSVRNNSYVFVKNQIVFVNDYINLNETNSRIYLRDEAQIIQGTETVKNTGEGELSQYQDGNVGAYEYNLWCSPVGNKTVSTDNNPFGITLLNDVVDLTNSNPAGTTHLTGYNGISSPLSIEPYWIWKYVTGSVYADWIYVGNSTTINPGEGFSMKGTLGSGDNQLYDFRGKPNTGTIGVAVLPGQSTLVGNPYPSALDALEYIHDPENAAVITGTLYFWEQNPATNSHNLSAYDGGYATYTINASGTTETYLPATFRTYDNNGNIVGTTGTTPSGKTPLRYLPVGQGFMVEGTAPGTVKAKNAHRVFKKESVPSDLSSFFKGTNTKSKISNTATAKQFSKVPSDYKRFRLNIDFNDTYTRQIVETFHPTATMGFDYGLESKINKSDILPSDAHWSNNSETYLAEALPFDISLKIPLEIKLDKNMPFRIRIADIQQFESEQPIYLHDIETDLFVNLKTQNFDVHLPAGTYSNRFEITFSKNTTLDIDADIFENLTVFQNNNASELKILNPKSLELDFIQLFDVSGKEVFSDKITSTKTSYAYSTKSLNDGVYITKIALKNNQTLSKKVVISNKK